MKEDRIDIDFNDISKEFLYNNNGSTLAINKENEIFYFKIQLKKYNNKLVVFSNGAVDTTKKKPPIFMRESWHEDFNASCIYIDDKTIHDTKLLIGWGVGRKERHYLNDYVEIIKKISESIYITDDKTFYYGSSAGGFMSIAMASMHKGTVSIANNPQTYVYNYYTASVDMLYEELFENIPSDEIESIYSTRLSLTAIFKRTKHVPKTFYLQNRLCKTDIKKHLTPFWDNLEKEKIKSNNINFILYNNEKSQHSPLDKRKLLKQSMES